MLVFTAFYLIPQNIAVLSIVKINRFTDTKLKTGKVAILLIIEKTTPSFPLLRTP